MDAAEAVTKFLEMVEKATAEELVTYLHLVANMQGVSAETVRRPLIRTLAVRLAAKVIEPGYIEA